VAFPFPLGVSGLIDPEDEPIVAILEQCAEDRRRLGLPSYTREDLDRLFQILDACAPLPETSSKVIRLRPRGRPLGGSRIRP
jgi:hypothetical protein